MLKKSLLLGIVLSVCVGFLFAQTAVAPAAGDGSENNPYQIASLENLYWIGQQADQWMNMHCIQVADIDASETANWEDEEGKGWKPSIAYLYSYDGNNHTINGLYIDRDSTDYVGLFGKVLYVKNLKMTNAYIRGDYCTGVIAGYVYYGLDNCSVENCTVIGVSRVGGIAGFGSVFNVYSKNCSVYGSGGSVGGLTGGGAFVGFSENSTVEGGLTCGGLAGRQIKTYSHVYGSSDTTSKGYCTNVTVKGSKYVGGIAGWAEGPIDSTYFIGDVIGGEYHTGGIAGTASGNISNCHFRGEIEGEWCTGGIVGEIRALDDTIRISNSSSYANISGGDVIGGIIGTEAIYDNYPGYLEDSYFVGTISGTGLYYGGLVGINRDFTISNCYSFGSIYNTNTYHQSSIGGLIGKNDEAGNITNSFSICEVTAFWPPHGIIGSNDGNFSNLYFTSFDSLLQLVQYDYTNNEESSTQGIAERSYFTDKQNPPMDLWDFDFTWAIDKHHNTGLPYLRGQEHLFPTETIIKIDTVLCDTTGNNAKAYFHVENTGDINPSQFGICWNTDGEPTVADCCSVVDMEYSAGFFSTNIAALGYNTINYIKAYATTDERIYYGEQFLFRSNLSGGGTIEDPILISSIDDLKWLSDNSGHWGKYFLQTCDIDAEITKTWNADASGNCSGWQPIGNTSAAFRGVYEGGDHTINNLYINRPQQDYIGLFGYTVDLAEIKNLGILNCNIKGNNFVGALNGYSGNNTIISHCYSTGSIKGKQDVGGLIGMASRKTRILNSYSRCNVTGEENVGGLLGEVFNIYRINYCYSSGKVNGNKNKGGLIGKSDSQSTVKNSFWDMESSELDSSDGGTAKRSSEMKTQATYSAAFWDFTDIWDIGKYNSGYPYFKWQTFSSEPAIRIDSVINLTHNSAVICGDLLSIAETNVLQFGICYNTDPNPVINDYCINNGVPEYLGAFQITLADLKCGINYYLRPFLITEQGTFYGNEISFTTPIIVSYPPELGTGTWDEPYIIETLENLYWVANDTTRWNKHYIQTDNINVSRARFLSAGMGWTPIGNKNTPFKGSYDGAGYIIDSLFIDRRSVNYVGLFGYVNQAQIHNLNIQNADITGRSFVGVLVGYSDNGSMINNCSATGNIEARDKYAGGLAGYNHNSSIIERSWSYCNVTGSASVGGLVGFNYNSSIVRNAFSRGRVLGTEDKIGGLVGYNYSSGISNCYSTCSVEGKESFGGILGQGFRSESTGNFWDVDSSGTSISALGEGKSAPEMKMISTYLNAGWDFNTIWAINENINDGYPVLKDTVFSLVGISDKENVILESFTLSQNYPNPFNPTTTLQYGLPEVSDVNLIIFDITGRKVKEWSISNQQQGWHSVIWDGTDMSGNTVSTGVYIYCLRAGNFVDTKKMVFMK